MQDKRLFETENPLEERVGKQFFDRLPRLPGIYRMLDRKGNLLYVGKAKNLRTRLFTYRRLRMDNSSRKTRKMIRLVEAIEIEELPSELDALLRENELIRNCKPPFNRAKKSPEAYYYLSAVPKEGRLVFDLGMRLIRTREMYTYGAFKGHYAIRKGVGALFRQLYLIDQKITSPFMFPPALLGRQAPNHSDITLHPELEEEVVEFLEGRSGRFVQTILDRAQRQDLLEEFIGKMILSDLEALHRFFTGATQRNREMIRQLGFSSTYIPQNRLDDFLVRWALKGE